MKAYIISILGITLCGVLIDIMLPTGTTSRYIKGIFSIFVVAVVLNPVITFFANYSNMDIKYDEIEVSTKLIDYINNQKVMATQNAIKNDLDEQGAHNIDITIKFSFENNEIVYKSCLVNLKKLVYQPKDKHISKYELITNTVQQHTNLPSEVIIFDE